MDTRFAEIRALCDAFEPCGSRVTCDPAPTGTDEDFVLLATKNFHSLAALLDQGGWERGGSQIPDDANILAPEQRFASWTLDDANLIITASPFFFGRFMAATSVCKRLNLLAKADRIMVFQAVLYGNSQVEPLPDLSLEEEPVF